MADRLALTIDRAGIARTYISIAGHVRRTPVIEIQPGDFGLSGAPLILKLELLQHSGSFKARGAFEFARGGGRRRADRRHRRLVCRQGEGGGGRARDGTDPTYGIEFTR